MPQHAVDLTGPQMALVLSAVEYAYKHALRGSSLLHTLNRDGHRNNKKTATQYAELLQHLKNSQTIKE
ncbi:hypothetical protein KL86DPRO_10484 [uncultured delta proteobacterium]|uniref:Uncharacterized protein n=1 Tax=uncultured delta proteobacterium TaxID=34034 RepID=A0A212J1T2_9DELT|nr:hypothetical protein KL86DPRO_10484 [uncultured delta proteobacterium]